MSETLALLARRFPAEKVKSRTQGGKALHYIDIPETIKRFNEVLGVKWSVVVPGTHTKTTERADGQYYAFTELTLEAELDGVKKTAYGVGAMVNRDPDMAAKTALAEAIKKAGHQFGIGLQLWDENERLLVDHVQDGDLKMAVQTLAIIEGAQLPLTADAIAEQFDVRAADLQETGVLEDILTTAGIL